MKPKWCPRIRRSWQKGVRRQGDAGGRGTALGVEGTVRELNRFREPRGLRFPR